MDLTAGIGSSSAVNLGDTAPGELGSSSGATSAARISDDQWEKGMRSRRPAPQTQAATDAPAVAVSARKARSARELEDEYVPLKDREWLTLPQVAAYLQISADAVEVMVRRRDVHHVPLGPRLTRVHRPTLDGDLLKLARYQRATR